jgi:hypothetical protein
LPFELLLKILALIDVEIYLVRVKANERDEISASVAAHAELGPRYDDAVAEGLVERIGEEIDKRVDARLRGADPQGRRAGLAEQAGPNGYLPPTYQPPPAPPEAPAPVHPDRRTGGLSGVILGLGSMGFGLGSTAVVVSHHVPAVAALFMVLLIWLAIAAINIAHSQRR